MVLLFDIDGVLNKSNYFTESYASDYGVDPKIFNSFFETEFHLALTNEKDLLDILPPYFKDWKWDQSTGEFLDYWFSHDVRIDYELLLILRHYRRMGLRIGLASQQETHRKKYLLNKEGLCEEFDCFYFSSDLGHLKTEAGFYQTILLQESAPIYFWDDTLSVVEIANQNGFCAYQYQDNLQLKQKIEEIRIENGF